MALQLHSVLDILTPARQAEPISAAQNSMSLGPRNSTGSGTFSGLRSKAAEASAPKVVFQRLYVLRRQTRVQLLSSGKKKYISFFYLFFSLSSLR